MMDDREKDIMSGLFIQQFQQMKDYLWIVNKKWSKVA